MLSKCKIHKFGYNQIEIDLVEEEQDDYDDDRMKKTRNGKKTEKTIGSKERKNPVAIDERIESKDFNCQIVDANKNREFGSF